jgi:cytochrome c oxidase cbb3-type subunit 3
MPLILLRAVAITIKEAGNSMRLIFCMFLLVVNMAALAAPDGAALYSSHCAACHGDKGNGGVGVPLALPSFLDSVDDRFLVTSIRYGRPGRVMPAFSALSDAQVNAIVSFIRSWSKQPAPVYASTPVTGDTQHGKELFASHCAACHGANGEGGRGTGVTLSRHRDQPIIAPALANKGFLQSASDEMIRHTLISGREGTPMRSFLDQGLSKQDIDDLVSYVRSFESMVGVGASHDRDELPAITAASPYSMEETIENLKQAITSQNFLLIRTDTLEHGLIEHELENQSQVILHFCNFKFLFDALAVDPRVGMFLPCRITITEQDDKVMISVINPLYLSYLFNNAELDEYCKRMREVYVTILEEATL